MASNILTQKMNNRIYRWYQFMALYNKWKFINVDFLNLGYKNEKPVSAIRLNELDSQPGRYRQVALYLKLLQSAPIGVGAVLEVACGFGGGCYLLHEYYRPKYLLGIDKLKSSVNVCNKKFKKKGIVEFKNYTSDNMHLLNQQFDMIVCLEASQHFPDWLNFYKNVKQLLQPDGVFFYGDIFDKKDIPVAESYLEEAGLQIIDKEDISEGVIKSIDAMSPSSGMFNFLESLFINRHHINFNRDSVFYNRLLNAEMAFIVYEIRKRD